MYLVCQQIYPVCNQVSVIVYVIMFRLIVIGLPCLSGFRLILFVLTFQFWLPSAVCCLSSGWFCLSIDYPACFSLSPHLFCSTSRNICLGFFRFLLSSVSALLVVSFILFIVIRLTHASFFIRFIPLFAFIRLFVCHNFYLVCHQVYSVFHQVIRHTSFSWHQRITLSVNGSVLFVL